MARSTIIWTVSRSGFIWPTRMKGYRIRTINTKSQWLAVRWFRSSVNLWGWDTPKLANPIWTSTKKGEICLNTAFCASQHHQSFRNFLKRLRGVVPKWCPRFFYIKLKVNFFLPKPIKIKEKCSQNESIQSKTIWNKTKRWPLLFFGRDWDIKNS